MKNQHFAYVDQVCGNLVGNHNVGLFIRITDSLNEHPQHMSHVMRKPTMWFMNRPDTNRAVQAQKMARK